MLLNKGANKNPIAATEDDKITYGTWLDIWSKCLHPAPVEANNPILATGEQFTPAIDPDNIADIANTVVFGDIPETTVDIIGINIPNVAQEDPTAKDNNDDNKNEVIGIQNSEILQYDITSLM